MRRVLCRYVTEEPGSGERSQQIVAILASALERALRHRPEALDKPRTRVDFVANQRVTTDCQSSDYEKDC